MTDLNGIVANALRLGNTSKEKLSTEIDRNIRTARAELIRSGVSDILVNSDHPLVVDAIVAFCLYKMDDESVQERNFEAFRYQQENLRKSKKLLPVGDDESEK